MKGMFSRSISNPHHDTYSHLNIDFQIICLIQSISYLKKTLSCRFSKLRSSAGGQRLAGKTQGARQNAATLQKASSKNSRLAQQMERRTSLAAAALKLKKVCCLVNNDICFPFQLNMLIFLLFFQ